MLNIYFGDMPSAIYNTEIYFRNTITLNFYIKNRGLYGKIALHYIHKRS